MRKILLILTLIISFTYIPTQAQQPADVQSQIDLEWSPDGESVVYVEYADQSSTLFIQDIATQDRTNLSESLGYAIYASPQWSPDGQYIAILAGQEISGQQYVLQLYDTEAETFTALIDEETIILEIGWSPNGEHLAMISRSLESGDINLQLVDIVTGEIQILTEALETNPWRFEWASDQNIIFSGQATANTGRGYLDGFWEYNLETETLTPVYEDILPVNRTRPDNVTDFDIANQSMLGLILDRNQDTGRLWTIDLETGDSITHEFARLYDAALSPDGTMAIVIGALSDEDDTMVYRYDMTADDASMMPLREVSTFAVAATLSPIRWSPDNTQASITIYDPDTDNSDIDTVFIDIEDGTLTSVVDD